MTPEVEVDSGSSSRSSSTSPNLIAIASKLLAMASYLIASSTSLGSPTTIRLSRLEMMTVTSACGHNPRNPAFGGRMSYLGQDAQHVSALRIWSLKQIGPDPCYGGSEHGEPVRILRVVNFVFSSTVRLIPPNCDAIQDSAAHGTFMNIQVPGVSMGCLMEVRGAYYPLT